MWCRQARSDPRPRNERNLHQACGLCRENGKECAMITISAFKWVPPFAQGLVRDMRARWALEEAGLPYKVALIALGPEQGSPEYRALQPFGQVPTFRENGLTLFESGAIVLHIAEGSEALMPRD